MSELEKNKELARQFFDQVWNKGDESAIDRFIAENALGNDPKFGIGRESFKSQWRKWRAAFPDINFSVEEIITEGSTIVTRWRLTGTHLGEYLGKAATGNKIDVDGVSIDQIKDGVSISGFDAWDSLGFREQIGLIPKTEN